MLIEQMKELYLKDTGFCISNDIRVIWLSVLYDFYEIIDNKFYINYTKYKKWVYSFLANGHKLYVHITKNDKKEELIYEYVKEMYIPINKAAKLLNKRVDSKIYMDSFIEYLIQNNVGIISADKIYNKKLVKITEILPLITFKVEGY